jgi:hypothetical protein
VCCRICGNDEFVIEEEKAKELYKIVTEELKAHEIPDTACSANYIYLSFETGEAFLYNKSQKQVTSSHERAISNIQFFGVFWLCNDGII